MATNGYESKEKGFRFCFMQKKKGGKSSSWINLASDLALSEQRLEMARTM